MKKKKSEKITPPPCFYYMFYHMLLLSLLKFLLISLERCKIIWLNKLFSYLMYYAMCMRKYANILDRKSNFELINIQLDKKIIWKINFLYFFSSKIIAEWVNYSLPHLPLYQWSTSINVIKKKLLDDWDIMAPYVCWYTCNCRVCVCVRLFLFSN